jgi:hypothetical protein
MVMRYIPGDRQTTTGRDAVDTDGRAIGNVQAKMRWIPDVVSTNITGWPVTGWDGNQLKAAGGAGGTAALVPELGGVVAAPAGADKPSVSSPTSMPHTTAIPVVVLAKRTTDTGPWDLTEDVLGDNPRAR